MKRYETPKIELTRFDIEDIITTSADLFVPKTAGEVAGEKIEATDFGTQAFSIFEN